MKIKKSVAIVSIILALVILLITGTVAWFISFKDNKFEGYNVTVNSGEILQVSLDGINFSNVITKDFIDKTMVDITGDGVNFSRPILRQENLTAEPDLDATWRILTSEDDNFYISLDLHFRATAELDVYLSKDSSVLPISTNIEGEGSNKSNYGEFSRNYIAGASRIAFVKDAAPLFVWVPNSSYQLMYDDQTATYSFNIDGESETEYTYYTQDKIRTAFGDDKIVTEISDDGQFLCRLEENNESGYYEGNVTVNIWVEGNDREARRALSGGIFNTSLQFNALEVANG